MNIDLKGLVRSGHLDLDTLFEGRWRKAEVIAKYNGDRNERMPWVATLYRAENYGVVGWKWVAHFRDAIDDYGAPTIDRDEAVRSGQRHAQESDRPYRS